MKIIKILPLLMLLLAPSLHAACTNGCPNNSGIGANVVGGPPSGAGECIESISPTTAQWVSCPFALPYPLAFYFAGPLPLVNSESDCAFVPNAATIPLNLARSGCSATTTAFGSAVFTVTDTPYGGLPSTVATFTFTGGSKLCTPSLQAAIPIAARDTVCVVGPASADAILEGVVVTVYATTTDYP
jgi:hypothetical protein